MELIFPTRCTTYTHEGYCSDNECVSEDESYPKPSKRRPFDFFCLKLSDFQAKVYLVNQNKEQEVHKMFDFVFRYGVRITTNDVDSGYCRSSKSGGQHELIVTTISDSLPTIRRDEKVEYFHYTMLFTHSPYRVKKARVHVRSWFMPFALAALQCLRPLLKELRQKILLIYLEEAYHLLQGF